MKKSRKFSKSRPAMSEPPSVGRLLGCGRIYDPEVGDSHVGIVSKG